MNPQDNTQANINDLQQQQNPNAQPFGGFGSANGAYENYNNQIIQQQQPQPQRLQKKQLKLPVKKQPMLKKPLKA